jgi:hypothetical protein
MKQFFLALKGKKVFFSLYSHASETLQKGKTMEAKRKEQSKKIATSVKVRRSSSSI